MPAIRPLEDLCLSCGLCCDGSLFWAVPLEEGQTASVPSDTEGYLRQPCPCFSGACTIYKDRPAGCRDFTCHVLDAVAAEQQDRDWALARIAEMRATLDALDAALPGGIHRSIVVRQSSWPNRTQLQRTPPFETAVPTFARRSPTTRRP